LNGGIYLMSSTLATSTEGAASLEKDLHFTLVTNDEDFFSSEKVWNELLKNSSADTIFLTWEWVSAWWKNHKTATRELFILFIKDGGKLIGIAPFYRTAVKFLSVLTVKRLDYIGFGSLESEYLDFIIEKGKEKMGIAAIFNYLKQNENQWDVLYLNEMPETSVSLQYLPLAAEQNGYDFTQKKHICSSVILPDSWDAFMSVMHYNYRKKLRNFTKRLENSHTVEFTQYPSADNLSIELESLFRLHQKHWQAENEPGSFMYQQRRSFYYDMAKLFLAKGWLRLYSLKVDGQFVAHQYCFEYANKIFSLQDGYDPDWSEKRVARVLRGYAFKDIIQRGLKEYDFLGNISDHKKNWVTTAKYSVNTTISRTNNKTRLFLKIPIYVKKFRLAVKGLLPVQVLKWRTAFKEKMHTMRLRKKIKQREAGGPGD
jgi:CelD/BcsL family acetyltransferase involved in cellulose biosynthesis